MFDRITHHDAHQVRVRILLDSHGALSNQPPRRPQPRLQSLDLAKIKRQHTMKKTSLRQIVSDQPATAQHGECAAHLRHRCANLGRQHVNIQQPLPGEGCPHS